MAFRVEPVLTTGTALHDEPRLVGGQPDAAGTPLPIPDAELADNGTTEKPGSATFDGCNHNVVLGQSNWLVSE